MAYGRQFEITVNCTDGETIHITDVDVDFSSVRDDEKEPNEADLTVWGLRLRRKMQSLRQVQPSALPLAI